MSHIEQEVSGPAPRPVEGITVHDSEVLEPDPIRQGGLVRSDTVCLFELCTLVCLLMINRDILFVSLQSQLNPQHLEGLCLDLIDWRKKRESRLSRKTPLEKSRE